MKQLKRLSLCFIAIFTMLIGCSAIASEKINIQQHYSPTAMPTHSLTTANKQLSSCGYGTHIRVINRSDYEVFVRIPGSGEPDFLLYPVYEGDNKDYIDSSDYHYSLHIIILAYDDYAVLYDGYVRNCQALYVDNAYSANTFMSRKTDKKALAKSLRVRVS